MINGINILFMDRLLKQMIKRSWRCGEDSVVVLSGSGCVWLKKGVIYLLARREWKDVESNHFEAAAI